MVRLAPNGLGESRSETADGGEKPKAKLCPSVLARFLGFDDFFLREYGGAEAMPTAEQVSVAARTSVNLFTSEDASRRRHNSVCVDVVSVCSGIGSQPRSQRATWVNP